MQKYYAPLIFAIGMVMLICKPLPAQTVSWTGVGDDGNFGTPAQYEFRWCMKSAVDSLNLYWASCRIIPNPPAPVIAGTPINFNLTSWLGTLPANISITIAMKTADEVPNWSGVSNRVDVMTRDTVAPAVSIISIGP
jgi:hypothetical protein